MLIFTYIYQLIFMKNILDGHGQHLKLLTLCHFTQFQGSTIKNYLPYAVSLDFRALQRA